MMKKVVIDRGNEKSRAFCVGLTGAALMAGAFLVPVSASQYLTSYLGKDADGALFALLLVTGAVTIISASSLWPADHID